MSRQEKEQDWLESGSFSGLRAPLHVPQRPDKAGQSHQMALLR